jgi:hypothetical protein
LLIDSLFYQKIFPALNCRFSKLLAKMQDLAGVLVSNEII